MHAFNYLGKRNNNVRTCRLCMRIVFAHILQAYACAPLLLIFINIASCDVRYIYNRDSCSITILHINNYLVLRAYRMVVNLQLRKIDDIIDALLMI